MGAHDDAEGRNEDTDGEADTNPPEHDDALLALRQEQGEEEDKPEHTHIQEEEDLRCEHLHVMHFCVSTNQFTQLMNKGGHMYACAAEL